MPGRRRNFRDSKIIEEKINASPKVEKIHIAPNDSSGDLSLIKDGDCNKHIEHKDSACNKLLSYRLNSIDEETINEMRTRCNIVKDENINATCINTNNAVTKSKLER